LEYEPRSAENYSLGYRVSDAVRKFDYERFDSTGFFPNGSGSSRRVYGAKKEEAADVSCQNNLPGLHIAK
jgi:hypothetical protein